MGLLLTFISRFSTIHEVYISNYSEVPHGFLLASIHVFFIRTAGDYVVLSLWFIIGFVLSVFEMKPRFSLGFYLGFLTCMLLYVPSLIYGIVPPPYDFYGEFVFISSYTFPFLINALACSIGGYVGGKVGGLFREKLTKRPENKTLSTIPIQCPNCGCLAYSNSVHCSNCGFELMKE